VTSIWGINPGHFEEALIYYKYISNIDSNHANNTSHSSNNGDDNTNNNMYISTCIVNWYFGSVGALGCSKLQEEAKELQDESGMLANCGMGGIVRS